MKIKINESENKICQDVIIKYLNDECKLSEVENYFKTNYPVFVAEDKDCFEIINEFYIDEEEYDGFKDVISSSDSYDYVIKHLKDLCIINIDENKMYLPKLNDDDPLLENFVKNGTLVLRMNRRINFGMNPRERISTTKKINEYIGNIEKEISLKLGIPFKILFNDISVLRKQ